MLLFGASRRRNAPANTLTESALWPFRSADPYMLASTLHGDARFGWVQHLARAHMFAPNQGWERLQRRGYPIARATFRADAHTLSGVIHWPHEGHRLVVGAPGSGKFTAVLALAMLEDDGANALVIDPKGGEAAQWSMVYRHTLANGQRGVFVLDPCGLFPGVRSQRLNPLDVLSLKRPSFVADADRLAEALVPDENLKDPFWVRAGRKIVRALIVHAVTRQGAARATLLDVQRWVANGLDETLLEAMAGNPVADGLVERAAVEISDWKNAESMWQGIKAQVDASLMFLDLPGVRHVVSATDFDVRALRQERATLYVAIPNSEKATLGR
jgi:type IV secretory pathway TraG/TraD family ATPase VirD4